MTKTSWFCTTCMLVQDKTWSLCRWAFLLASFPYNTTTGHVTATQRLSKIIPSSIPLYWSLLVWPLTSAATHRHSFSTHGSHAYHRWYLTVPCLDPDSWGDDSAGGIVNQTRFPFIFGTSKALTLLASATEVPVWSLAFFRSAGMQYQGILTHFKPWDFCHSLSHWCITWWARCCTLRGFVFVS